DGPTTREIEPRAHLAAPEVELPDRGACDVVAGGLVEVAPGVVVLAGGIGLKVQRREEPHAGLVLEVGAPFEEALAEGVVQRAADPELTRGGSAPHHHPAEQIGDTLAAPERLTGREVGGNLEDAHDAPRSRIDLA